MIASKNSIQTRLFLSFLFFLIFLSAGAQYQMEFLTRGVHAAYTGDGKIFISWRLLGTEPRDLAFNIYRTTDGKTSKLNKTPMDKGTNFTDETADTSKTHTYNVKTVVKGKEQKENNTYTLQAHAKPWLSIPLKTPPGYSAGDASVGDVDGDGVYEIILHMNGRAHDNSQAGITDPPIFQCYKLDGTLLWEINLGKNIREGAHYTQFLVYDLDGDGKAEVAMKTADGSIDAKGNVIGDSTKDWRNERGYILAGPEYFTIFDGLTGKALATTDFIPSRYPTTLTPTTEQLKEMWGDGYGNRMDRFLGAVAYLDGKTPSLVMTRGYYTRTFLTAWDWKNGKLTKRWTFDSDDPANPGNRAYRGQGNHNLTIADVDDDGKDEIVYGAMTIDDNGKGLYSTGLGHGDALHVSDLDPSRPGLEVFDIQERFDDAGANFRDAKTGEVIWKKASVKAGADGEGPGRGLALDIDPRYPGVECWVAGAGITGLFDCKGNTISDKNPPCNMGIFWDADVLSEILNGTTVSKWNYLNSTNDKIFDARDYGCASNNGTKANPCLSADLWGDWREEVIYRTSDSKELRIFSTAIPTTTRLYTLMHNPQYRLSIAWQNVAYNQPPHTSYFIGEGMKEPPKPNIQIIKPTTIK
jgi:rhamnogalacturonan endolyase